MTYHQDHEMELKEIQSLQLAPAVSAPFAASWSDDNKISLVTEKGLYIVDGARRCLRPATTMFLLCMILLVPCTSAGDITNVVFGGTVSVKPAAFGDFNSDELTDLFVIHGSTNMTLEVMLASDQDPLLRRGHKCLFPKDTIISSVVPGNFDGDAHMDVMVALMKKNDPSQQIHILWGGGNSLDCSGSPIAKMRGQPVAFDYNQDMIVDLYGEDTDGNRTCIVFKQNRTEKPDVLTLPQGEARLRIPHSHAFIDLNGDYAADLLLSTEKGFEVHLAVDHDDKFMFNGTIKPPAGLQIKPSSGRDQIGQSLFLDLELTGKIYHLLPVCFDGFDECGVCMNSTLYAYVDGNWYNLNPEFKGSQNQMLGFFVCQHMHDVIKDTVSATLRAGDFNMDGYPDLLATLATKSDPPQVFLLENIPNKAKGGLSRTFAVRSDALANMNNKTGLGAFYDLYQDGVLDVILYGQNKVQAFRNTLDYDANFVKVMVLTGRERGGNIPGPRISYRTTTQEGTPRAAVTGQLPQSAHFALGLPYTIFGLGRTPNFVDTLTVGVAHKNRDWTQIIPNSQMVVIPYPLQHPSKWRAQLFITPSKMILLSVAALLGTCVLITTIIGVLYWKERREDRIERLQEAHRFHFDAIYICSSCTKEILTDPDNMLQTFEVHRNWIDADSFFPTAHTKVNCDSLIWRLNQREVYQMVLDTYLAPNLTNTRPLLHYVTQMDWSPAGMLHHGKCLLASVTNYGCVLVQAPLEKQWTTVLNLSSLWIEHCSSDWNTSITWSTLLNANGKCYGLLIVGLLDGTLLFWRLNASSSSFGKNLNPTLILQQNTGQYHITTMLWRTVDENSGILYVGDVKGLVKMHSFKWEDGEIHYLASKDLWPHNDRIQVKKLLSMSSKNDEVTIIAIKGSAVFLDVEKLLVLTHNGSIHHLAISRMNDELKIEDQALNNIVVPKSAYYGIASSPNHAIFCLITSFNVMFDHLIQREPAQLTFFKLCGHTDPFKMLQGPPFPDVDKDNEEELTDYELKLRMWFCRFAVAQEDVEEEEEIRYAMRDRMKRVEQLVQKNHICKYATQLMSQKILTAEDQQSICLMLSWLRQVQKERSSAAVDAVISRAAQIDDLPGKAEAPVCVYCDSLMQLNEGLFLQEGEEDEEEEEEKEETEAEVVGEETPSAQETENMETENVETENVETMEICIKQEMIEGTGE
ncbi:hypothetical protein C0J52_00985 [Blattella germanica]|nr:hypothetical protein C0J52_00985 [Blattella germanica]